MTRALSHSGWVLPIETEHGVFLARYSAAGLAGLSFPSGSKAKALNPGSGIPAQVARWHALTAKALGKVLAGKSCSKLPPLDLSTGTDFQRQVWHALASIRSGTTSSYSAIAKEIGRPRATRAVGSACGANPIPVLVPCHRVLAANRGLGGFSGGLDWKKRLLESEGSLPAQ